MFDFILVDENNTLIDRTHNYACEKKWYTFKCLRPQKAALKAYNSIVHHNTVFKKNENNFISLSCTLKESNELTSLVKPLYDNYDQILKDEFIEKMKNLQKITKSLFIYVRKVSTNKYFGYFVTTHLNLKPNLHELKNKIVVKTKAEKISGVTIQEGLKPLEYKEFL